MKILTQCVKKAQSALEFLTTYGWALLVILIMITALSYFGILDPGRVLPDRCTFGAEFECLDFKISGTDDELLLRLKNNLRDTVNISSFVLETEISSLACVPNPIYETPGGAAGNRSRSGQIMDFGWISCDFEGAGFVVGTKEKVLIDMRYNSVKSGPLYDHEVRGEIFSTVI